MSIATTTLQADELLRRVESSLDKIRPYLETDGGNVRVQEITHDMVVKLEFVGNCVNCPMSSMTFKAGVEEAILKSVPEIRSVEVLNMATI